MTDDFLIDIRSQPETLKSALDTLRPRLDDVVDFGPCHRVVLTGSGDSLIAATALEGLFRAVLSAEVRAVSSLDAAAFEPADHSTLLVAVSVSGEVSRTIEAALRFRHAGAVTAAVTANPSARLGTVCDHTVEMPKPLVRSIPHARDYTASLLALLVVAERLHGQRLAPIDAWIDVSSEVIESSLDWAERLEPHNQRTWFLGAGPDRATAMYGALKFWEAGGMDAAWDDLEEFAHGSHILIRPGDRAFIATANGRGLVQAAEIAKGLGEIDVPAVVISDGTCPDDVPTVRLPSLGGAVWQPLVSCLPVQAITRRAAAVGAVDIHDPYFGREYGPLLDRIYTGWTKGSLVSPAATPGADGSSQSPPGGGR